MEKQCASSAGELLEYAASLPSAERFDDNRTLTIEKVEMHYLYIPEKSRQWRSLESLLIDKKFTFQLRCGA